MNVRELIKKHEGLRLAPYQCTAGRWTIGWGHNLDSHGETIPESISLQQAEAYFEEDLAAAIAAAGRIYPEYGALSEARQAVLIDMAFNLGEGGLAKFHNMLKWIRLGYWKQASLEMVDSLWAKQVGHRATRLAAMMETGGWVL